MKFKARDYQEECLGQIAQTVEKGEKRALVVMASALGKTITSAFALQRHFAEREFGRVLVLCHSDKILRQSKERYRDFFGEEYSYGMYIGKERASRRTDFLFATFQTMKEHRKEFPKDTFAYVVVDEAHHSKARTYFPTIHYFQPEFLLGLTATPDRLDGQKIEEIYGDPVYELDFIEATNRGLIAECDYRLVLDDLSQEKLDEYLASDKKLSINQLNRTLFIEKRDEEIVRLIGEYSAEVDNPRTIIFCKTIEHAQEIARLMGDKAALMHSGNADSVNYRALEDFRNGEINTIVSIDMLNEGIDVPDANIIVFLRNTVSPSVFYQQLGRGTRLSEGKEKVLVLDFVNNCNRIQMILELKQQIDDFRVQTPVKEPYPHGAGEADSREKFTLNIATPEFREKIVDVTKLLDRAVSWYKVSDQEYLDALVAYARELGHVPSRREVDSNPALPSSYSYIERFKTYNNAVLLAGLNPNVAPGRVGEDNDVLLDGLRSFAKELGRIPTQKEVEANKELPCVRTYVTRFKSFRRALALAGLEPVRKSPKKCMENQRELFETKEDVIIALQKLYKKKGGALRKADLGKYEKAPTYSTVMKFFPDLNSAFAAAGVVGDVTYSTRAMCKQTASSISRQRIIQLMQVKYHECGNRTPTRREIMDDERFPSPYVIADLFGSYNGFVIAAGLKVNRTNYSRGKVKLLLENKAKKLGHWPSTREIRSDESLPDTKTIRRLFGSTEESVIRGYVEATD